MKKNTSNIYTINTETGEGMSEMIEYFRQLMIKSSKIPSTYFNNKNMTRRNKINKIIDGIRYKSL